MINPRQDEKNKFTPQPQPDAATQEGVKPVVLPAAKPARLFDGGFFRLIADSANGRRS